MGEDDSTSVPRRPPGVLLLLTGAGMLFGGVLAMFPGLYAWPVFAYLGLVFVVSYIPSARYAGTPQRVIALTALAAVLFPLWGYLIGLVFIMAIKSLGGVTGLATFLSLLWGVALYPSFRSWGCSWAIVGAGVVADAAGLAFDNAMGIGLWHLMAPPIMCFAAWWTVRHPPPPDRIRDGTRLAVATPPRCAACDYDLRGLARDAACPECGASERAMVMVVDRQRGRA